MMMAYHVLLPTIKAKFLLGEEVITAADAVPAASAA